MSLNNFSASVIVPVRNSSGVVVKQLDALKNQSFQGLFQVLVVDDHSSDETASVVESWIKNNPDFSIALFRRLFRGGPNASRNDGIRAAQAPILLFCDGDDIVDHKWVETLVANIDDNLILCGLLRPFRVDSDRLIQWSDSLPQAFGWDYAYGGNIAMSTALARYLNGFDETILYGGTEVEFAIRAQLSGVTIRFVPQAVVNYRLPSLSSNLFSREFRKERGRAYICRKLSGHVDSSRDLRHFLHACKKLIRALIYVTRQPQGGQIAAQAMGRISGWMVWYVRFLISLPPPRTLEDTASTR